MSIVGFVFRRRLCLALAAGNRHYMDRTLLLGVSQPYCCGVHKNYSGGEVSLNNKFSKVALINHLCYT